MTNRPCRNELLAHINAVSFAVDDIKLFLDTHPENQEALSDFYKYSAMRKEALKEYASYYTPLTIDTSVDSCTDRWSWINEPWPWQEGGC